MVFNCRHHGGEDILKLPSAALLKNEHTGPVLPGKERPLRSHREPLVPLMRS